MMKTKQEIHLRDPFVLVVPEEQCYYLYGTTDENCFEGPATGFDVYKSNDLEMWEGPYQAFRKPEDFWANENFWAPEVYKYEERYYMFASFYIRGKERGTQVLVADTPMGPFTPHSAAVVTPKGWECLDGTFYVDREGIPWMIFCHEWRQIGDGAICAVQLSKDLKEAIGEPIVLFHASDASWSYPSVGDIDPTVDEIEAKDVQNYVTDGPFIYENEEKELLMLWSSYTAEGYAIGIAKSESRNILGPWYQQEMPLFAKDGGHGMIFKSLRGKLFLAIHTPNYPPHERPIFIEIREQEGNITLV